MGWLGQNVNTFDFFLGIVKFLSIKFVPMDIPTSNVGGVPVCPQPHQQDIVSNFKVFANKIVKTLFLL